MLLKKPLNPKKSAEICYLYHAKKIFEQLDNTSEVYLL